MELIKEITKAIGKEQFESFVPVAKVPERNFSIVTRLKKYFELAAEHLQHCFCGEQLQQALQDCDLKKEILRYVCLKAFIDGLRSLDLVLTSTGFGVVSTQSTAPASQQRVEALDNQLRMQLLYCQEDIIDGMIKIEGWGDSMQAINTINILSWRTSFVRNYTSVKPTYDSVQRVRQLAIAADELLRKEVSAELMDDLLHRIRTGELENKDYVIMDLCNRFAGDYASKETPVANRYMLDACVRQVETYADMYPAYRNSQLYAARHAERYKNKKEDPSFFFM